MSKPDDSENLHNFGIIVSQLRDLYKWDAATEMELILRISKAIQSGELKARDYKTGWPRDPNQTNNAPLVLVSADDINNWFETSGYPFIFSYPQHATEDKLQTPDNQRPDALHPLIERAIAEVGSDSTNEVFTALKEMALDETPPFMGVTGRNLDWVDARNNKKSLSKDSLRSRLKRRDARKK